MNISRWHRDTSLLALSLSIDSALRSKEELPSKISEKLRSYRLGSNTRTIVGLSLRSRGNAFKELAPAESANASRGFHTSHEQ
jgi:hypothetical protein